MRLKLGSLLRVVFFIDEDRNTEGIEVATWALLSVAVWPKWMSRHSRGMELVRGGAEGQRGY